MSMGIPGEFDSPQLKAYVAKAEEAILKSDVALGGVARTPQEAKQMLDRGYRLLALGGFDWRVLQQACSGFLEEVRRCALPISKRP